MNNTKFCFYNTDVSNTMSLFIDLCKIVNALTEIFVKTWTKEHILYREDIVMELSKLSDIRY